MSTIRIRRETVRELPLERASFEDFHDVLPWRSFRWHKGQMHYPGLYWSATMRDHVGYESRLELASLIMEDFHPAVTWIASQPFQLHAVVGGRERRHVPDYLVRMIDGGLSVIDVKPRARLERADVREALGWARAEIESRGWRYRIVSEPDRITMANVRFLAGYRRDLQFPAGDVNSAYGVTREAATIGEAIRAVTRWLGDAGYARALVLHLLWTRRLQCDLSERPLASDTPLGDS